MQFSCRTIFDITETGITGSFKSSQIPFRDRAGQHITDFNAWNRSRNQQRNFETVLQILQLRTQIFDVTVPKNDSGYWSFEFSVEAEGIYNDNADPFGILRQDCAGVPMLLGLDEEYANSPIITVDGSQQNIWFDVISVNN